jgi:hypothetical protein
MSDRDRRDRRPLEPRTRARVRLIRSTTAATVPSMRALVITILGTLGCNSKSERTGEVASGTGSATVVAASDAATASGSAATVISPTDPRLAGALEGCKAVKIQYGPYRMQPGASMPADAKRCAAVIVDESYRVAALAVVDRECAGGDARACYVAASLRTELVTSIGIGTVSVDDHAPRFVIRTFKPHNVDTRPRTPSPEDQTEATRLFARACELGDVDGCAHPVFDRANAGDSATEVIAFACKHGSDYACQLQQAK